MPEPSGRLDQLVFRGEQTPLLFRREVVASVVGAFLLVGVAYLVATQVFGVSLSFDAEPFQDWVEGFGVFGPTVFIAILAASVLVAPIPNAPIFIAAGLAWGPVVGTVYCMAGQTIGSAVAFWLARRLGRKHLARLVGPNLAARLDSLVLEMGGRVVFWSRMIPAVNFDWISFAGGMTAVPFRVFIFYSFLGMLFPTALTVVAGDGLGRDMRVTFTAGAIWVGTVVASAGYFWWRRRRWQAGADDDPRASTAGDSG